MLTQQNHEIIENYYRHIRELIIQLDTVTFESRHEEEKTKVLDQLKALHNKLSITNLMANRSLVAITGLQGTGKTTIIKRLYELPEDILPENSGRGERLPVFITEKKVDRIETYVNRPKQNDDGHLEVVAEKVSPQEFNRIAMNPKVNEDLWLECMVPERYLKDEMKSIVLLPGFEKDDKDISQLLLEHILYLSNSSVMVLRKDTFARESTQEMMRKVKQIYKNMKPVIAITFGDVNADQNAAFKKQIMEEFELQVHEHDHVVITGEKPQFSEDWQSHLKDAIDRYGYENNTRDDLVKQLIRSLARQMDDALFQVRKILEAEMKKRKMEQGQLDDYHTILISFETISSKFLSDLENDIKVALQKRTKPARDAFREHLAQNTTWGKELKTKFFGQKPQELYELEEKIQEIWENPYHNQTIIHAVDQKEAPRLLPPNLEILEVVTKYVNATGTEVLQSIEEPVQTAASNDSPSSTEDKKAAFLARVRGNRSVGVVHKKNEPTQPLARIDAYFKAEDALPIKLNQKDCKTLAVIGTMLIRETYLAEAKSETGEIRLDRQFLSHANVEINPMEQIEKLSIAAPKLLKAIPVILGLDGLIDGEMDLLSNATAALAAIGIKLSGAQLLGIFGAGFAAAYAAKAIQESMRKANERQLQLSQAGERIFNELPEIQAKAFINGLKRTFDRMADQLVTKHLEYSGRYDQVGELEHLTYTVRKIGLISQELKRVQYEQSVFI
ncbi:hypothetical protein AA0X95_04410 [Bacillus sp. 1P10SD]|uniref:hypothetical protein n=1 Tax=Bacillus sp. 1P10SD TaxID=3132265 RepID=UPI0039A4A16B